MSDKTSSQLYIVVGARFAPKEHLANLEEETMLKRTILAAALLTLVATPVFAGQCPRLMKEIDTALAQNPQVAADVLTQVKALRAEGETLHKSSTHGDSVAVLNEAKGLLGI